MRKRIYISADYDIDSGDRNVVDELYKWGKDIRHVIDFVDMAEVVSGSVSSDPDCRPCDLKQEFNRQINAASAVIVVIGDKTATRVSGSSCSRLNNIQSNVTCTPYKHNSGGTKLCKVVSTCSPGPNDDVGNINKYSYIRHEFEQAKKKNKQIIVVYNSLYKELNWLPSYMKGYESLAVPFWTRDAVGRKVGNYSFIKRELGYE